MGFNLNGNERIYGIILEEESENVKRRRNFSAEKGKLATRTR